MRGITSLSRFLLFAGLVASVLGVATWLGRAGGPLFTSYLSGEASASTTATVGPLQARIHSTLYTDDTQVYVWLKNTGGGGVRLFEGEWVATIGPGEKPPPPVPYYLTDDGGRRYPSVGTAGWTFRAGDPPDSYGKVPPGDTADFTLGFPRIPDDVRGLTLVMEGIKAEDGKTYDLRVPVPLPR